MPWRRIAGNAGDVESQELRIIAWDDVVLWSCSGSPVVIDIDLVVGDGLDCFGDDSDVIVVISIFGDADVASSRRRTAVGPENDLRADALASVGDGDNGSFDIHSITII